MQSSCLIQSRLTHECGQLDACIGRERRQRENGAITSGAQRVNECCCGSRKHSEIVGCSRDELRDLCNVTSRFLHPDNVRVCRQPLDSVRQQIHSREHRHVVEHHRNGRRLSNIRVVPDEHIRRHLRLEERRRPDEHRIDTRRCRSPRGFDRCARGLATGPGNQRPIGGHAFANDVDGAIGFGVVELSGFSV